VEAQRHAFGTSVLGGGEWSYLRPGRFNPGDIAAGALCMGGRVDPRAGVDAVEKRKIPSPAGNQAVNKGQGFRTIAAFTSIGQIKSKRRGSGNRWHRIPFDTKHFNAYVKCR
jgi:hypothetical protein